MPIPEKFWQPWSEIDPTGNHGGIAGALSEYVGPRLGDNAKTKNVDIHTIFIEMSEAASSLSRHPAANTEGPPIRPIMEETLRALNLIFERILDRTRVCATGYHYWTHATPPMLDFKVRPIRYPLRSMFAEQVIYFLLGTLVETAEVNANDYHSNLDPSSAYRLTSPLYHLKANIIRDYFDIEVENELTTEELVGLTAKLTRPGPTIVPAGSTQPKADSKEIEESLSGVDVLQWFPDQGDWVTFARKQMEVYKSERIWQPEGAGSSTEDIAPSNATSVAAGANLGIG